MQVFEDIFRVRVSLPFVHETTINTYFINDKTPTLIEAGPGYNITATELFEKLKREGFGIEDVEQVVNTHEHPDHFGGNQEIKKAKEEIRFLAHRIAYENFDKINYSPPKEARPFLGEEKVFLLESYAPQFKAAKEIGVDRFLDEGDRLRTGKFSFEILHLPGHAPGHICLYEPNYKLLFSGDNVIGRGTPYIGRVLKGFENARKMPPMGDMNQYLQSLKRLQKLDIDLIIPAHGPVGKKDRIFETYNRKIEQTERVYALIKAFGPITLIALTEKVYANYAIAARLLQGSTAAYVQKLLDDGRVVAETREHGLVFRVKSAA